MASQRETNTMGEILQRIMGEISKAKTLPDTDLPMLQNLEDGIVQYMRAPTPADPGMPGSAGGAVPMQAGPGQAGPGVPAGGDLSQLAALMGGGGNSAPAVGVPQRGSSMPPIAGDELARMLSGG